MGAVIDEDLAGRVEVCVIGTSEMSGRGFAARRPLPAVRTKAPFPGKADPTPVAVPKTSGKEEARKPEDDAKPTRSSKAAQEEFGFGEVESRGYFEKTDRNLFDGQDLDVPTYLRKGIKITI
jgi:cell division protein FtsZ